MTLTENPIYETKDTSCTDSIEDEAAITSVGDYSLYNEWHCFIHDEWVVLKNGELVLKSREEFLEEELIRGLMRGYRDNQFNFIQDIGRIIRQTFPSFPEEIAIEDQVVFRNPGEYNFYLEMDLSGFSKFQVRNRPDLRVRDTEEFLSLDTEGRSGVYTQKMSHTNLLKDVVRTANIVLLPVVGSYTIAKKAQEAFNKIGPTHTVVNFLSFFLLEWKAAHWLKIIKEELKNKLPPIIASLIEPDTSYKEVFELLNEHQEKFKAKYFHEMFMLVFEGDAYFQNLANADRNDPEHIPRLRALCSRLLDNMREIDRYIPYDHIRAAQLYFVMKHICDEFIQALEYYRKAEEFSIFNIGTFTEFYMKHDNKEIETFLGSFLSEMNRVNVEVIIPAGKKELRFQEFRKRIQDLEPDASVQSQVAPRAGKDGFRLRMRIPKYLMKNHELRELRTQINQNERYTFSESETELYNRFKHKKFMEELVQEVESGQHTLFVPE